MAILTEHSPHLIEQWSPRNDSHPSKYSHGSKKRVWWKCEKGHEWEAPVYSRVSGRGCPFCSNKRVLVGFNDLASTHPGLAAEWDTYGNDISPEELTAGAHRKVSWVCERGHRWKAPVQNRTKLRSGCPGCDGKFLIRGENDLRTRSPEVAKEWAPDLNGGTCPDEVHWGTPKKAWWRGTCGHEWESKVSYRTQRGYGCPVCTGKQVITGVNDLKTHFPQLAREWHPENDKNPEEVTVSSKYAALWICSKGHEWVSQVSNRTYQDGTKCRRCGWVGTSRGEGDLAGYIKGVTPGAEVHVKLPGSGYEYDVVVPEARLAFEYNGLYWHSDKHKQETDYHLRKSQAAERAGYQLIHVWEDDWRDRQEIVKKMIARKMGVSDEPKLNARSLQVTQLKAAEARLILDKNHIQGFASGSWYGALKDGSGVRAVMVMKLRKNGDWELARFATSAIVRGGHSKLLKAFIREQGPQKIITFADRGVSDGGLYKTCGFAVDGEIAPDYTYLFKGSRVHKFNFRKPRFRDDPDLMFEGGLTERELAEMNNLPRIYDAGKVRWVWGAV